MTEKSGSAWRFGYHRVNLATMLTFGSLVSAFNPTLSLLAKDLNISPLALGLVFSLPRLFGVLLRIPAGMVAAVVGHRKILLTGSVFCILGPLLLLRVDSYAFMFLATIIYGFTNIYAPAAISLVNEIVPEEQKTTYLGYHSTMSGIGRALGPVAAGFLIDWTEGYTVVFQLCALCGVVAFFITWSLPEAELAKVDPSLPSLSVSKKLLEDFRVITTHAGMLRSTTFRGLQSLIVGGLTTYFPWYAKAIAGLTASDIGVIQGSFVVGSLGSRSITAQHIKKKGHGWIMTVGTVISGLCMILCMHVTGFWNLFLLMTLIGICEGACHLAALSYLGAIASKRLFGGAMGLLWAMADLGTIFGRVIPGALLPVIPLAVNYANVFSILGVSVIVSALVLKGGWRGKK